MVSLRIWSVVLVGVVLALLSQEASAAEPAAPVGKSECPKECQQRARAAFAFAKLKTEAQQSAPTTAPMPTPKRPACCLCGDACQCAAGECPAKCPVSSVVAGIASAVKPTAPAPIPTPMPAAKPARILINGVPYELGADGVYRPCQK